MISVSELQKCAKSYENIHKKNSPINLQNKHEYFSQPFQIIGAEKNCYYKYNSLGLNENFKIMRNLKEN